MYIVSSFYYPPSRNNFANIITALETVTFDNNVGWHEASTYTHAIYGTDTKHTYFQYRMKIYHRFHIVPVNRKRECNDI